MYQFLMDHIVLAVIFIAIVLILAVYLLVKYLQKLGLEKVRATVYKGFVLAENSFKQGDNKQKFEYVVQLARSSIPAPFNLLITESTLRKVVQLWFDICKDLLDDGRINKSEASTNENNKQ